jgi:thiamine biosynthesis lipoprotein
MIVSPPAPLGDSAGAARVQRFAHQAMACTFEVLIEDERREYARAAADAAFAEVDRLERVLSRFRPDSDVARINALGAGESLLVGVEVIECLALAAEAWRWSAGAFDITFASRPRAPESDAPASAGTGASGTMCAGAQRSHVGWPVEEASRIRDLWFDVRARTVGAASAGVVVDFGALGKGYALDGLLAVLREWGFVRALAHAGQSTAVGLGEWRLGLRDPADNTSTLGVIQLAGRALSGSGQRLHGQHIVRPPGGPDAPAASAAWALSGTATWSDALSTAFMLMPPDAIQTLCLARGVSALVVAERSGGRHFAAYGAGWPAELPGG